MTTANRLLGAGLAAAALAATLWSSNASLTVHASPDAVLRLAWSALPERVETCREASADELARLPPHMRQRLVCEGHAASYHLTVRVGGAVVADRVVRAGGWRQDRRLYVYEEVRVPTAESGVEVRFDRIDPAAVAAGAPRSGGPASARAGDWIPPHLVYIGRMDAPPRRVVLITYDARRRTLVAVRGAPQRPMDGQPSTRAATTTAIDVAIDTAISVQPSARR